MSQTIENRIVEMQFENKQFESGVSESLSTLDKLKAALKFDDATKNLQDFGSNINKNIDLSGISKSIDGLNDKFSTSGIVGMEVIRKLTDFAISAGKTIANALDAPFAQIRQGGWKRAMNIEDAKFQLKGLGVAWEKVFDDIDYAVADTAYGLDVAAKACGQLSASGVQAGKDMKAALRGISGVATMGNTEYENITDIFTKAAGNGRVMAQELNRISQYGLNARAEVVKFFNDINSGAEKVKDMDIPEYIQQNVKALTKGTQMAESDLADFVKKGKLDFESFAYAMDYAFGTHAKAANETFMGTLRNVKAALSKIGAEFATPIIQGAIPVFNEVRIFLNDLRKQMGPVFEVFRNIAGIISDKLTKGLQNFRYALLNWGALEHIGNAIKNAFMGVIKVFVAIKDAFEKVFPPAHNFARVIDSIAVGIENFSKHLVMSDEAMITFRNVMVIVFNIIKSLATVIKSILPIIGKVVTMALKIINVIVTIVAYVTTLISKLDIVKYAMDNIQKAGGLFAYAIEKVRDAFYYLKSILSDTSTITGQAFAKMKDAALIVAYVVGGTLYMAFMKLKEIFADFNTHDPLGSLLESAKKLIETLKELPIIKEITSGIEIAFGVVSKTISTVIELVKNFVSEINNGKTILEALGSTLEIVIGGAVTLFGKLVDKVKSFFGIFQGERIIEENIEAPIYGASAALVGFEHELTYTESGVKKTSSAFDKAKDSVMGFGASILNKIKNLNASKIILAAYAAVMLMVAYNTNELIIALGSLTRKLSGGFMQMFKPATTRLEKFKTTVLAITGAIATLATSIYVLTKVDTDKLKAVIDSLFKIIALVGALSIASTVISEWMVRWSKGSNGFYVFGANMIMLASGIGILVGALKMMDTLNLEGIWIKVGVLGAIGLGLSAFAILVSKFAPQLTAGSLFMVAFAASTLILVKALDNLSRVNFDGIKENWEEMAIIIVAFGAFAALAGTVGVSSIFSLIAFLLGMKLLVSNFDQVKDKLKECHVGEIIMEFCTKLKEEIKAAVQYIKDAYDHMTTLDKWMMAIYGLIIGGSITAILVGISKAANSIKKATISAVVFAASIVGLMVAFKKIAEACTSIPKEAIDSAQRMLLSVGGLMLAVMAVAGIFGGDTSKSGHKVKGRGAGKTLMDSKSTKNRSNALKEARKMLFDMGVLLASVALFVNVVGKLSADELAQAEGLLWKVVGAFTVISTLLAIINLAAAKSSNSQASIIPFVGTIALLGSLLGAFAVLMYYFSDFDFEAHAQQLYWSLGILAGIIVAIGVFLTKMKSIQQTSHVGTILAFVPIIGAIGAVVYALMGVVKTQDDLKRAGLIAGGILAFILILEGLILGFEKLSTAAIKTEKQAKRFNKSLIALGVMVAAIGVLGGTFYALRNVDPKQMGIQALELVVILAAISALVLTIQKFTKDKKYSLTSKSMDNFKKTMLAIAGFFAAFEILALTFYAMRNVDAGRMAKQMGVLIGTLTLLSGLVIGITTFVKKTKANWADMNKAKNLILEMTGIFAALAVVFKYIINTIPDPTGMLAKSQIIMLALYELAGLMAVLGTIAKLGMAKIKKAELALLGMLGIFTALALVFKYIVDTIPDPVNMLAKSQIIMLALYELAGLVALCGVIGKLGLKIAGGEIALIAMVGIFAILAQVFKVIDNLQTEGIMAKSQTIVLVLLELGVLAAAASVLSAIAIESLIGDVGLIAMVGIFAVLVQVFEVIDGLKTEGIMAKSQTIILVLFELETVLSICSILSVVALVGGIGLIAMVGIFAALTQVFTVIDSLKTEGILAKSQTIILVLLELEALSVLSILGDIALLGAPGLAAMIGVFGQLTEIFTVIDTLHVDGLLAKSQAIILVLLELEGLSILSILGTIALIGAPGLEAMVDVFGKLAIIFTMMNGMQLEGLAQKADIIVATISKLSELGLEGFVNSFGLDDLAESLEKLTDVIFELTNQAGNFALSVTTMSSSLLMLIATGTQMTVWSESITSALKNTQSALSDSANAIIRIINNMIDNMVNSMHNGQAKIKVEAENMGKSIEEGFNKNLKPDLWGSELATKFANGIRSGASAVSNAAASIAHTVWEYLHFSGGPEKGDIAGNSLQIYGLEGAQMYSQGWLNGTPDIEKAIGGITGVIKNGFSGIDLNGLVDVSGLLTGEGDLMSKLNGILQAIGLVKSELGSLHTIGHGTKDDFLYQLQGSARGLEKELDRCNQAATRLSSNGTRSGENAKKKADEVQKKLNGVNTQILELTTGVKQATPEVEDLSKGLGGLGDSAGKGAKGMKEAQDEIADFYSSIESAINLFEEFNRETELTSDQLLQNMRSQIEGVTEWSNQIAKLAFMGIDQGLLQELADMGPQGYEYTNAFIHMTADQLAEANNLYHQSLMLPTKVTSQVYGSYTIAGRNAASGFLQGMQKEDIKAAAVGFAHQVVDGLNQALDIASGYSKETYKDGKAVTKGTADGINDKFEVDQMGQVIENLCKFNIEGGFNQELIRSNTMYTVGKNITAGVAKGVEDDGAVSDLRGAVIRIVREAKTTAEHEAQIKSPSRVFAKIGGFLTLGMAKGITDKAGAAINAMGETTDSLIDQMRESINRANEALIEDVDEPVIKPVLDLSEIENGSRDINNVLSRNRALSASRSFNNLQNEQWNSQSALLNATMDNSDIVSALTGLKEDVISLKDAMTNIKMVLDTGTMVGAMTPMIDQELGLRKIYAGRGI